MLKIKKRSIYQILALYVFITPFFLTFLQEILHLPGIVKYTVDVAWVAALVCMFIIKQPFVHKNMLPFVIFIAGYFLYVLTIYLFNYQSAYYFLWGLRNNFRYLFAFIAFIYFLDKDDVRLCLKAVDIAFIVHVALTFIQFFFLGYKWDYLGGIFGTQLGCNGNSLLLLLFVFIKSLLTYMNGGEKLLVCLLKCGISLVIAAMSELKVLFVFSMCLVVLATVITKFSFKKVTLLVGILVIIAFAGNIFATIWGEDASLNFEQIIKLITSTNYSSSKDLGRFTAIPILSRTILTETPDRLFGLGLGNCDTSTFAICNTPFYQTYSYLNYNWLSSAFLFLETGYIGMAIFITFFLLVFFLAVSRKKAGANPLYCEIAILMSFACVVLMFYNSSLRTDVGYIAYFALALPFVSQTDESLMRASLKKSIHRI